MPDGQEVGQHAVCAGLGGGGLLGPGVWLTGGEEEREGVLAPGAPAVVPGCG